MTQWTCIHIIDIEKEGRIKGGSITQWTNLLQNSKFVNLLIKQIVGKNWAGRLSDENFVYSLRQGLRTFIILLL